MQLSHALQAPPFNPSQDEHTLLAAVGGGVGGGVVEVVGGGVVEVVGGGVGEGGVPPH